MNTNHLTISKKISYYEHRGGERADVVDYSECVDLLLKYGSFTRVTLSVTEKNGTKSAFVNIEAQFTYPLAIAIRQWEAVSSGPALLDYNKHRWLARIGFSMARRSARMDATNEF